MCSCQALFLPTGNPFHAYGPALRPNALIVLSHAIIQNITDKWSLGASYALPTYPVVFRNIRIILAPLYPSFDVSILVRNDSNSFQQAFHLNSYASSNAKSSGV